MVKTVSKTNSYTNDRIKIAEYLIQGHSAAEITKKTGIPKSTLSRYLKQMREGGLITYARRDPLCNKSQIYNVDQRLRKIVEPSYVVPSKESLCDIHNMRFKAKYTEKSGELATDIKRFANAQFRFVNKFSPKKNDIRYIFEKTGIYGRYKIICYRNSLEVVQVDRPHIEGKDIYEKENKLSIELAIAANRFVEEQRWCGCLIRLGELSRVGKYDIAMTSQIAQELVKNGENTHTIDGIGIDNSLNGKNGKAEIEGHEPIPMNKVDKGLTSATAIYDNGTVEKVNYIYKNQGDMSIIKQTVLSIPKQLTDINNAVMATCQSGMTRDQQFGQLTCILADLIKTVAQLGDKAAKHDDILISVSRNNEQIAKNNEQITKILMERK